MVYAYFRKRVDGLNDKSANPLDSVFMFWLYGLFLLVYRPYKHKCVKFHP